MGKVNYMNATIKTTELKRFIKATEKFISKEDYRPMLQYIKLEFNKDNMIVRAIATDKYKLAIENAECCSLDESFTAYIKPYLPAGVTSELANISLTDDKCLIDIDGSIVGYRQPKGNFGIIDKSIADLEQESTVLNISVNKKFLEDALKSTQTEKSIKPVITLELKQGELSPIIIRSNNGVKYVLPCRR